MIEEGRIDGCRALLTATTVRSPSRRQADSDAQRLSMMPEQRQQQNDRQRNAKQPQQCTSSETHDNLLVCQRWKTRGRANGSSTGAAAGREETAQRQSPRHSIWRTDCPTGKSVNCLTSPLFKNIPLNPSGKSALSTRPSHPTRGACARHERAVGCGGR